MTSPEFGTSKPAGAEAEKEPAKMPVKRRLTLVAAVTGLVLLPAIIMVLVTWVSTGEVQGAATWASIPAIVGIAAAMAGGFRFAVIVSIVTAFLAPVMIVAGLSPVSGAALMAILCLTVGRLSRFGLQKSGLLVPVMLAWPLIDPPAWDGASSVDRLDNTYLLWMTLIFLVGGLVPDAERKLRVIHTYLDSAVLSLPDGTQFTRWEWVDHYRTLLGSQREYPSINLYIDNLYTGITGETAAERKKALKIVASISEKLRTFIERLRVERGSLFAVVNCSDLHDRPTAEQLASASQTVELNYGATQPFLMGNSALCAGDSCAQVTICRLLPLFGESQRHGAQGSYVVQR